MSNPSLTQTLPEGRCEGVGLDEAGVVTRRKTQIARDR